MPPWRKGKRTRLKNEYWLTQYLGSKENHSENPGGGALRSVGNIRSLRFLHSQCYQ